MSERIKRAFIVGFLAVAPLGLSMASLAHAEPLFGGAQAYGGAEASALGAGQGSQSLDSLLSAFKKSPGVSAHFVEEKHIALLKKPLKSEGNIYFAPPGKLARHVDAPKPSKILLEGDELRISDGKGVRSVDLGKNAAV